MLKHVDGIVAVLTIQTALKLSPGMAKLLMISFHTDQMIAYIFAVNIESNTQATFPTTTDGMKITNISTYRQILLLKLIN